MEFFSYARMSLGHYETIAILLTASQLICSLSNIHECTCAYVVNYVSISLKMKQVGL